MRYVLNLAYAFILLLLLPWLCYRAATTGRYRHGLRKKLFGTGTLPLDPERPTVWFHGVSLGEIQLLVTVVKAFRTRHPDWQCVVSTTTETGLAEARRRFPDLSVIPFPFDFSWAVRRTIRAVRPRLIVLAESELWPNFLGAAQRSQIPVVVINGRMSPRSLKRYRKLAWLARPLLFGRITRFAMQSQGYAEAMLQLGIPSERIHVTGSVKYDGASFDRENPRVRELRRLLALAANMPIWVAGSTHAPEEQIVLEVLQRLLPRFENLRLILVPRSPERFDEVARLIEATGLSWVRRSQIREPLAECPRVVLIDTIGELGAVWGLASVGFTGGSLDGKRGGQSMIEPAAYGVPVVFGRHVWNFRDAVARLLEVGGARQVEDLAGLERELAAWFDQPEAKQKAGEAAQLMVRAQQGATERTLDLLDAILGTPSTIPHAA